MRAIGTLQDEGMAVTLAEYLLTLRIETRLDRQPDGWVVWVCDEDRVAQGRQEMASFLRNPYDPRYAAAVATLHRRAALPVEAARPAAAEADEPPAPPARPGRPWTFAVLVACLTATVATNFGQVPDRTEALQISVPDHPLLWEVRQGELWRLVTPIFLHFGFLHLAFNLLFFVQIGSAVEERRGPGRYLGLMLVTAVLSNLVQYFLGHPHYVPGEGLHLIDPSPSFGGLSGVLYGLFAYVWVKGRLEPELGLDVPPATAMLLMMWLVLCLTPSAEVLVGAVANGAHVGGLLVGGAVAAAAPVWRSLRRRGGEED